MASRAEVLEGGAFGGLRPEEGGRMGDRRYSRCAAWRLDMALRADIEGGKGSG